MNNKPTIFGEESFIIPNLAREFINQTVEYRNDKFIGKIACDFLIDKDKVKRQLELCARLENIDKTDLIDIATKKKLADKDYEIKVLQKALKLACNKIGDMFESCYQNAWFYGNDNKTIIEKDGFEKYFKQQAKEMLGNE